MLKNALYDTENKEMIITFINNRNYTYEEVEKSTYEELVTASSPGKYFNSIKQSLKVKQ